MSNKVSIKEIARKSGTSPSTVSRVLNNPEYRCNTPGLREKIWQTAAALNYTPNEAARNLRTGKNASSEKIRSLHVLLTRTDANQSDPFFNELLHFIEVDAHKSNCIIGHIWHRPIFSDDMECSWTDLDKLISQMLDETDGKTEGLIIIGKCNKEALRIFYKKYRAIVSVNRNPTDYLIDEVTVDGQKIAMTAVDYLISLGHKDIGYIGSRTNESRYRGYIKSLENHQIDIQPQFVLETHQTESEGFHAMEQILKMKHKPTAIYCANDITAIGVLKYLSTAKTRFYQPSIISSDDIEAAQLTQPMLTTVRLPKDEMGSFAVKLLLDRLNGEHKSMVRIELEGKLMIRSSCHRAEESYWPDYVI